MTLFLKLLPTILGAIPSLIQLAENAFGGSAPSQQAHQDAVVNLVKSICDDVIGWVWTSPEGQLAEKVINDVVAAGVTAWYDVKNFLAAQNAPAPAATVTAKK